jgi:hypothetical protein
LPDRLVNSHHEFHDVGDVAGICLNHRKFIAPKPRDKIGLPDTALQAGSHHLQQFIADMMPERIVDGLEFVDVDIKQCELLVPFGSLQLALDLFAEQHPVWQVSERVVMRKVRNLLVGAPAIRHIVDNVYYVARLAGLILDPDTLRGDKAFTESLAFPRAFVQEDNALRLQCLVVVGSNDISRHLRKYIEGGLANDFSARQAELSLGHPIGQKVTAITRILDRDLRRYVINDLKQECVIPVTFLFEAAMLGYVLHRRHPAALWQRPIDDPNRTSVCGFEDAFGDFSLGDVA